MPGQKSKSCGPEEINGKELDMSTPRTDVDTTDLILLIFRVRGQLIRRFLTKTLCQRKIVGMFSWRVEI